MKLETHLAASTVVGVATWAASGEVIAVPAAIAAGVLPDIDHLLDYYNWYWRRSFERVFLLLHAWEWVGLLVLLSATAVREPWMVALAAGYTSQVALDQLAYRMRWYTYFFVARAICGFRTDRLMPNGPPIGSFRSVTRLLPVGRNRAEKWFVDQLRLTVEERGQESR